MVVFWDQIRYTGGVTVSADIFLGFLFSPVLQVMALQFPRIMKSGSKFKIERCLQAYSSSSATQLSTWPRANCQGFSWREKANVVGSSFPYQSVWMFGKWGISAWGNRANVLKNAIQLLPVESIQFMAGWHMVALVKRTFQLNWLFPISVSYLHRYHFLLSLCFVSLLCIIFPGSWQNWSCLSVVQTQ